MIKYVFAIGLVLLAGLFAACATAPMPNSKPTTVPVAPTEMSGAHQMPGMNQPEMSTNHEMGAMTTGAPTPGAMTGMQMEPPVPDQGVPIATDKQGAQPLAFKVAGGVKVFNLTAKPVK